MKFFIDTANLEEIRIASSWGILDGVTTNPTLISKEKKTFSEILPQICEIVDGPISVEVISKDPEGMIREAKSYAKLSKNIVIKVPIMKDGLKVCKVLCGENIKVNMTLIFSPSQALLAAKAGAHYISPFIGRLDDISQFGMDLIKDIMEIFRNYNYKSEVIVASIRNPLHVVSAAKIGAHIATIPFNVLEKLINHPLTDIGIETFLKDHAKKNPRL